MPLLAAHDVLYAGDMTTATVVYVDVDDTLVRTFGTKRVPRTEVVEHVRALHASGAELYCWSAGGAAYAEEVAAELGLGSCFRAFLPKPHALLDDQPPEAWRGFRTIHPNACPGLAVGDYRPGT